MSLQTHRLVYYNYRHPAIASKKHFPSSIPSVTDLVLEVILYKLPDAIATCRNCRDPDNYRGRYNRCRFGTGIGSRRCFGAVAMVRRHPSAACSSASAVWAAVAALTPAPHTLLPLAVIISAPLGF